MKLIERILAAIFGDHSVDNLLADFHKTVAKLEKLNEHHMDQHAEKTSEAMQLHEEAGAHLEEAIKANAVAVKIRELVS